MTGSTNAMYRPITAIDVPTAYPTIGFFNVGSISAQDRKQMPQTEFTGTRSRETRRQSWCPGTARSRLKANIIRDADVTDARPQKNCATHAITSRNSAHLSPMEVCQMYWTANPYCSATSSVGPGIANVTATSRMN